MPHQCTNCGHVFEDGSKEMLSGCPDCGGNKFQYHPGDVADDQPADEEPPEPPEAEGGSVTGAVGRAANRVRDAVTSGPETPAERTSDDDAADAAATADSSGRDGATADSASGGDATADSSPAPETGGESEAPATDANAEETPANADATAADAEVDADTADAEVDAGMADSEEVDAGMADSEEVDAGMADSEDTAQADARSEVVDRDSLPDAPSEGRVVKEPDDSEDRPDLGELRAELNDQFESIRIVAPGEYELNLMELYDRQEYIIALQEDGQYVIEVPDAWETEDV